MTSEELLKRAVEEVVPEELAQEKLKSGKKLRVYLGIDPTGTKLHLGHSVPLRKLKAFADAGHHAIFLIGSYTAMIGDPTGRDAMRAPLSRQEVEKNFETYKKQAEKILDFSKIEIRYNHEWLEKLTSYEILQLTSHFTVQQMLQRDMFQERMKRGEDLNPTEFLYPVMVGYDSVILDVDCEIGGNDQLFNMLCGRKLQKAYGKRDKFVLTTRLIEGTDGRKMSKTYDNCIYLTDEANDMYGKVLRIKDELILTYMECTTDIPMEEIKEAQKAMKKGANPKEFKMRLAPAIVTLYHGEKEAMQAEEEFQRVFSEKKLPEEKNMKEIILDKNEDVSAIDALIRSGFVKSKSQARQLINEGAIKIMDESGNISQVVTIDTEFGINFAKESGHIILKIGKKNFAKYIFNK